MSGSNLFVLNNGTGNSGTGTVGEYGMDGSTVNPSLVSGLYDPLAIAVTQNVPEPASLTLLGSALLGIGLAYLWRLRARA